MRQMMLIPLLTVTLAGTLNAQAVSGKKSTESATRQVLQMEDKVNQAIGKSDWRAVSRIWSPDMDYTNSSGQLLTQADFVNALKSGQTKFLALRHSQIRARAYGDCGDMVVVTGYSTSRINLSGKISVGPRRFTDVWAKRDGEWRLVVHHVTNVEK